MTMVTIIRTLAIFGSSVGSLIFTFSLFLVACSFHLWVDYTESRPSGSHGHVFILEDLGAPTAEMFQLFANDGAIAVRGLIQDHLLEDIRMDVSRVLQVDEQKHRKKKKGTQFHTVLHGPLLRNYSSSSKSEITEDGENVDYNSFRRVALGSTVADFAAQLLQTTTPFSTNESLSNTRVMRDILLIKDEDEFICGWHVDDMGFWPAMPEAPGVNAWIALDDMPLKHGGGFALAIRSHTAPWRHEAYAATGSSMNYPSEGFQSAEDVLAKRTGSGTCNIKQAAPHLHAHMESAKRVYSLKKGDVIFHDRWLFHRTIPFERAFVRQQRSLGRNLRYARYSIRYGPGSSRIPRGYGVEWSVLWNKENGGRTADEVCRLDAAWYPKAWPLAVDDELASLQDTIHERLPSLEELKKSRHREMTTLLKQRQHH